MKADEQMLASILKSKITIKQQILCTWFDLCCAWWWLRLYRFYLRGCVCVRVLVSVCVWREMKCLRYSPVLNVLMVGGFLKSVLQPKIEKKLREHIWQFCYFCFVEIKLWRIFTLCIYEHSYVKIGLERMDCLHFGKCW